MSTSERGQLAIEARWRPTPEQLEARAEKALRTLKTTAQWLTPDGWDQVFGIAASAPRLTPQQIDTLRVLQTEGR